MHPLATAVRRADLSLRSGPVIALRGHTIDALGPTAQVGEICRIESADRIALVDAEVLGFSDRRTVLMPLGTVEGLGPGCRVVATGRQSGVRVGEQSLGRVVDAWGEPVDGRGPIAGRSWRRLQAPSGAAMARGRVVEPLETGIRAIDSMLTLACGQRIGLFAGSGVGKSSLMGAMARGTQADVNVIALIGERSREVREFVEDQLGAEGLSRSVVVVATSSESAALRLKAAHAATSIAEFFRDRGRHVLLMMDSLTRFAMARREVGLALGEPPTARGYTPSVFAELPQLCERSGPGEAGGSITGVYTVLVEGDDFNEPIADAVRGILDGHIVLSRTIANQGRYPAIDVLGSISRLHAGLASVVDGEAARRVLACCALFERNRQLIEIGAYKPGVNPPLDRAVALMPRIEAFLAQPLGKRFDRAESLAGLRQLADQCGGSDAPR